MILTVLILSVLASSIALPRLISHDGYGTRPGPRSHPPDLFDPGRHLH